MSLKGNGVRIIVHEPEGWGTNLIGVIKYERRDVILVELSTSLNTTGFTSNLIQLKLKNVKDRFHQLEQYQSLLVDGFLLNVDNNDSEQIIVGTVTLD